MHTVKTQGTLPGMTPPPESRKKRGKPPKQKPAAEQPAPELLPESLPEQAGHPEPLPDERSRPPAPAETTGSDGWPPMAEMLHNVMSPELVARGLFPVTVLGICAEADVLQACARLIDTADVICAGRTLLEAVGEKIKDTERLLPLTVPIAPVAQRIESLYAGGKRVLVLVNGDPLYFGIGATFIRALGADAVRVIPAVSILQLACARLGLPWHLVANISLHGRDNFTPLNVAAARGVPICALTDDVIGPDTLARHLLDRGADWFEAHVFEHLGTEQERERHLGLAETAEERFSSVCTTLLVPNAPVRRPYPGIAEKDLAVEGGVFTKPSVRATALSLLRVRAHHTVWDIGAGSGVVALEACALAHAGHVVAVERNAVRAVCVYENRRRFGATVLDVCEGDAPHCLPPLPNPDRVFIGGGLSHEEGADILSHVWERLPGGGRVVTTCALLDTLDLCRT
ncbi:MAG: precorrin-6y C5,15-methyltransferase (decarboxylating) subunit CbiE, partial [Desulfovibrio sp.]|nr:precorrin-6y C5,15-methyltransferase (decarboxylating) subunit CbiE [Desulfovibrio sp.]